MPTYAGIGARKTPNYIIDIMKQTARLLALDGYTCNTCAARGADQAFEEGCLAGFGQLQLFLPWGSYEKDWISTLQGKIDIHVLDQNDRQAMNSVQQFHPTPGALKQSVYKLHARNYNILLGSAFVVCWTPNGMVTGGTGQGIRIANSLGIHVYNLGNKQTLKAFEDKIKERTTT